MANKRNLKKGNSGRDAGGFVALPWSVIDCKAYARLSHPARSLLMEIARQFVRDNNGRLLCSRAFLAGRGWKSADVIQRAKSELLDAGFIHETVMGHRPNKASWYAITWQTLDHHKAYDPGASETFRRGAYAQNQPIKNAVLVPSGGTERPPIAPSGGTGKSPPVPSGGAIGGVFGVSPVPSGGHHLEVPSAGCSEPAPTASPTPPTDHDRPDAIATRDDLWAKVGITRFRDDAHEISACH